MKGKYSGRKYCEVDRGGMLRVYPSLAGTRKKRKRLLELLRKLCSGKLRENR